jgi:stage II sporulation protein D
MPTSSPTDNTSVDTLKSGEHVIAIGKDMPSNSFQWISGPYSAAMMLETINAKASKKITGPLTTLNVTKRGPSGRAMEVMANSEVVAVRSPDSYRTLMGGLRSTLFDIEQTGSYTVMGAGGKTTAYPNSKQPLHVLQGKQAMADNKNGAIALPSSSFVIVDGDLQTRVATKDVQFRFHGKGFGHGLGLSQWGAMGLAEQGMNYEQILKHYYTGVTVTKE